MSHRIRFAEEEMFKSHSDVAKSFIILSEIEDVFHLVHAQIRMDFFPSFFPQDKIKLNELKFYSFMTKISNDDTCHCQFQRDVVVLNVPFYVINKRARIL